MSGFCKAEEGPRDKSCQIFFCLSCEIEKYTHKVKGNQKFLGKKRKRKTDNNLVSCVHTPKLILF